MGLLHVSKERATVLDSKLPCLCGCWVGIWSLRGCNIDWATSRRELNGPILVIFWLWTKNANQNAISIALQISVPHCWKQTILWVCWFDGALHEDCALGENASNKTLPLTFILHSHYFQSMLLINILLGSRLTMRLAINYFSLICHIQRSKNVRLVKQSKSWIWSTDCQEK